MADKRVLTVSQLNIYVKSLLESSSYLNEVYIIGEISNFTDHYKSGHLYMSLKDDTGVIKAVMFRQYASALKFKPENGMKIICKGKVSLYERDGAYQMYITNMQPQGMGELNIAYQQLKEKLQKEGLFDSDKKQPIPRLPSRIAVITSPTGAAVQDILNILTRRYPVAEVIMCPVQVQGDLAAPQLIEAIKNVNKKKCADVIIIGRGGGSIED
ncbi:MAG: exodeoxyribonuclease VII large subunit, partial [Acutalibacteraceae bacterium]|nr:exodeoxyribonuclease VII large subunit [Acutalibacteraceae bacterium]